MSATDTRGDVSSAEGVEPTLAWPRYSNILVALDQTAAAAFALRHAVPYAVDHGARVTLLAVVPKARVAVVAAGVSPLSLAEAMERDAAAHLRRVAAALPQEVSVTTVLRHGDPAEEILRLADEEPIDVICMGARGQSRVAGALLGSVSSAVLHRSAVPVVVWHPPPDTARSS